MKLSIKIPDIQMEIDIEGEDLSNVMDVAARCLDFLRMKIRRDE